MSRWHRSMAPDQLGVQSLQLLGRERLWSSQPRSSVSSIVRRCPCWLMNPDSNCSANVR
jgi:hypothetical protein